MKSPNGNALARNVLVLVAYVAVSFAYFGWRLLPHPGRPLVGVRADPLIFVWSFAWWPHALGHLTNPFVTHALFAPEGFNLAWTSSVPGLALAFAPVTVLFGPVVAYNVAAVLLPALAAWTAFLLCRYLTGSTWAALVGGYLFGFSSFVLGQQLQGHLHMTGIFLLPLLALAVVRFVDGVLDGRGLVWRVALIVPLQLSISTEIALTMTIALAIGLGLALWRLPDLRGRLRSAFAPLLAGYGIGALLAAPLLVYAVIDVPPRSFTGGRTAGTEPLNLVVPTRVNGIAGSSLHSLAKYFSDTESGLYLGLPLLVMVVLFAWKGRRARVVQLLVAGLVVSIVLALGPSLRLEGRKLFTFPWEIVGHLPGLENVRDPRYAVYTALAASVIVALWIVRTPGRIYQRPFVLPVLAIAALVPAVGQARYEREPQRVPFFADGLYRSCLHRGENVAIFPYGHSGDSMLWQAESGFRFRLAGGYMYPLVFGGPALTKFDEDPTIWALNFRSDQWRPTMESLLAFAGRHHVGRFVTLVGSDYPSERQMRHLGSVERIGGVLVSPGCADPPLTSRNLTPVVRKAADEIAGGDGIAYCLAGALYMVPVGVYPSGVLAKAARAWFVEGKGLSCDIRPPGFKRHGFATPDMNVPANTYPYYGPG